MNQLAKKRKFLFLIACFFLSVSMYAQSLYPVSIDEKIAHSPLIIEGKVMSQQSFWNTQHSMIYTSNKVEIYKIFKGTTGRETSIEILTQGGSVEGDHIEASDLLALQNNSVGVFFCFPNQVNIKSLSTGTLLYDVYSSAQGAITYDLSAKTASAPFARYNSIQSELYKALTTKTGLDYKNVKPSFSVSPETARESNVQVISITSFSPAAVNAGALLDPANNVLTINGSGFGVTPSGSSAVLFDDADNGTGNTPYTVAYNDPLIISWNDTQIRVRVPTKAGTGSFQVRDNTGTLSAVSGVLQVIYSVATSSFLIGSPTPVLYTKEVNLMNVNGSGGYTIFYSTNTANSGTDLNADPAKTTFQRALTTWKEKAGFNITEGGTVTNQVINPSDGVNVIMYDNTATGNSPLAAGVLATCYSFSSMCSADPVNYQARKTEFDVVIRKTGVSTGATTFTMGPCPPNSTDYTQIDLETVILHELGHALNLGHINDSYQGGTIGQLNPNKLMNYAVVNSVKRVTPDYSAYAGALYSINPQGNTYGGCILYGEMVPLATISESKDECPLTFPSTSLAAGTTVNFDLVHATSNRFTDPAYTQVRCDGFGAAVTNNAYYAFKTNNAGGILSLAISGYATTPAALASCTQAYGGIPVTGIRLSLYQVSACPAAGSFPTPVACQIFTGNGNLADIAGLAANTNYLLYLDGVENTKANFSVTFTGAALPLKLTHFSGKQYDHFNQLYWTAEALSNLKSVIIQRSSDASNFEAIGEIPASAVQHDGVFTDNTPFAKENYYRLAIVNTDGSKDYSATVLLKRNDHFMVSAYPVPATGMINIRLTGTLPGKYTLTLSNIAGQQLKQISTDLTGAGKQISLPASQLSAGIYYLHVADQKGTNVYNIPVIINR